MGNKYLHFFFFLLFFSFNTLLLNVSSVPGFVQNITLCRLTKCSYISHSFSSYPPAFALDLPGTLTGGAERVRASVTPAVDCSYKHKGNK